MVVVCYLSPWARVSGACGAPLLTFVDSVDCDGGVVAMSGDGLFILRVRQEPSLVGGGVVDSEVWEERSLEFWDCHVLHSFRRV